MEYETYVATRGLPLEWSFGTKLLFHICFAFEKCLVKEKQRTTFCEVNIKGQDMHQIVSIELRRIMVCLITVFFFFLFYVFKNNFLFLKLIFFFGNQK